MKRWSRTGIHKMQLLASQVCSIYENFRGCTSMVIQFMERRGGGALNPGPPNVSDKAVHTPHTDFETKTPWILPSLVIKLISDRVNLDSLFSLDVKKWKKNLLRASSQSLTSFYSHCWFFGIAHRIKMFLFDHIIDIPDEPAQHSPARSGRSALWWFISQAVWNIKIYKLITIWFPDFEIIV